jgi:hypothetical protein
MPNELPRATAISGDDNINVQVDAMRPSNISNDAWDSIARECYGAVSKTSPYYPTVGTRLEDAADGAIFGAVVATAVLLPFEPASTVGGAVIGAAIGGTIMANKQSQSDFRQNFAQCVSDKS